MDWDKAAKNLLKAELVKRDMNYEQLHEKLMAIGINETVNNIARKINRGSFQLSFFLQCASAMCIKNLRLEEYITYENQNSN